MENPKNILIIAIGSRGDIEPFLPIAQYLKREGHQVTCLFPAQLVRLAQEAQIASQSLSPRFLEMLHSKEGRAIIGGKLPFLQKLKIFYKLYKQSQEISKTLTREQHEFIERIQPDVIIHSLKAIYPLYWAIQTQNKSMLISPIPSVIHPVKGMSAITFQGKNWGAWLNAWTHRLTRNFMASHALKLLKPYIGSKPVSKKQILKRLLEEDVLFSISPSLAPEFVKKQAHVKVIGFPERDKAFSWQASPELLSFLDRHQKILFVSFGSMTNAIPEQMTQMFLNVLSRLHIPAIINTGEGGLKEPAHYPQDKFYFTSQIPYDWIFPKVYAVVHHGGSGTSHMGLRRGCPTLIIPHIADQFLWNRIVYTRGLGPKGKSVAKVKETWLMKVIEDLYKNQNYWKEAQKLAKNMASETFDYAFLSERLKL